MHTAQITHCPLCLRSTAEGCKLCCDSHRASQSSNGVSTCHQRRVVGSVASRGGRQGSGQRHLCGESTTRPDAPSTRGPPPRAALSRAHRGGREVRATISDWWQRGRLEWWTGSSGPAVPSQLQVADLTSPPRPTPVYVAFTFDVFSRPSGGAATRIIADLVLGTLEAHPCHQGHASGITCSK